MKKRINIVFVLLAGIICSSFSPGGFVPFNVRTVVIDAGHGGKDPGCHGVSSHEKHIALAVALKLGKQIEENFSDVKVVYTRKTDVFIELQERAAIANRAKADLFISIHCNSACYRDKKLKKDVCRDQVSGVETYVMGLSNETGNLAVAKRENATIFLEDNYQKNYEGFDPNSDEANIIFSLYQNVYLEHSLSLASKMQKQYKNKAGRIDRGVKRASLWVLWKTAMPSLLTEIGFLSNADEEKFLASENGQNDIATSMFRAFREYKNESEGKNIKYNDEVENPVVYKPAKDTSTPAIAVKNIDTVHVKKALPETTVVKIDPPKTIEINKDPEGLTKIGKQVVFFKVQVLSSEKKLPLTSEKLKSLEKVFEYEVSGIFKYTSGDFDTLEAAVKHQTEVRKQGFNDAFVVAFKDGKRIAINDAIKLVKP